MDKTRAGPLARVGLIDRSVGRSPWRSARRSHRPTRARRVLDASVCRTDARERESGEWRIGGKGRVLAGPNPDAPILLRRQTLALVAKVTVDRI